MYLIWIIASQVIGGTVLYAPPFDYEMSFGFDDWACGVILFAMLTRSLPFREEDLTSKKPLTLNIPSNITEGKLTIIHNLDHNHSQTNQRKWM
jgi:hypothetical protein